MEKSNIYPDPNIPTNEQATAPPSYTPNQPAPVFVQQHVHTTFGPHPQVAQCTNCSDRNVTRVEYENGNKTHIAALLMCLVGLWCCCCIPYCVDSLKNANHYCQKCGNFLGVYNK